MSEGGRADGRAGEGDLRAWGAASHLYMYLASTQRASGQTGRHAAPGETWLGQAGAGVCGGRKEQGRGVEREGGL